MSEDHRRTRSDTGRVYLDHNATSPIRPAVAAAVSAALELGNPSSIHAEGRRARSDLEAARRRVAALVGAAAVEAVVFTSGGTEANNAALRPGAMRAKDGRPVTRLITQGTEHPSVLLGHSFPDSGVVHLAVDGAGCVSLEALDEALSRSAEATLVSIQVANSETGVVQPISRVTAIAHGRGAAVHADAVQAAGRIPLDMTRLGLDALSLSGHKLGGPKGAGALVISPAAAGPASGFITGGGQERGRRAGTENVPGIVGLGMAAELAARSIAAERPRLERLRDGTQEMLVGLVPDLVVFGKAAERLPNTLALALPGIRADTLLMALDLAGAAVSSGSACSSGKVGRSHVLAAMGVEPGIASGAIRISFGWNSHADDVVRFRAIFETVLQHLYQPGRARAA